MQSVQSEGPFYLGGYCFGALVAFEIARQLQAQRQDIALLALLNPGGETRPGGGLPQVSSSEELRRHLRAFSSLALHDRWRYIADRALQKAKSEVSQRIVAPIEKIAHPLIWKICERFGVSIPISLRSSYILKIYARALRAYAPQRLDVDLILLLTDDYSADLVAEWRARSTGKVSVHRVPGDHTSVLLDPHARVWAEKLKACLNGAGGSEPAVSEHNPAI
jgi:thioesterase domain-containing protein